MFMVKLTQKRQSVTRLITPVALALALAACSAPSTTPTARDVISQPATENSTFYLLQAETSQGEKQNDWFLLAIKALINEQQLNQADVLLQRLAERNLNTDQRIEWTLARGRFLAQTGKLTQADQALALSPDWQLTEGQYVRFYQQKAKIARQQGNALDAVNNQHRLASYIESDQAQQAWNTLWQDLQSLNQREIKQLQSSDDDILAGWVTLLDIARRYTRDLAEMQSQLDAYLASHPTHPANQYLPDNLADIQALTITQPTNVGVMLPLTDKFADQGDAIRDGFIEAMLDAKTDQRPRVRFYDTNAMDVDALTQRIRDDGIDFVVGAQAADRLHQQGYQFPLVLYPDSAFGQRIRDAFSARWQSLTDTDVEQAPLGDRDKMQARIRDIFGLDASQRRISQLKKLTDLPLQSQARSRRDIDAVYMVAGAAELTLLKPFIEVAINPDVLPPKLYASSRSNNRADGMGQLAELEGIEFSDIPLLVHAQSDAYKSYQQRHPSPSNNTTRLHALGMDAYQLLKGLPQMQAQPGYQLNGQTGQLSLADQCIIHRQLDWARFGQTAIEPVETESRGEAQ